MPSTVSCRATGGYPPPDLTIHIDKSDVTDEFSLQHRISYSGKKSLRRLIFTSWRMKHGAMMKRSDDGRRITCVATVPGLQSNSTSAIVTVHHKPSIACEKTLASLGERNVHLKCTVISKPPTHFLYWVVDSNSTRLSEGDFINGHWTQIAIRPGGGIESKLYMLQVKPESYRKYKLVAGNAIGNHSQETVLAQKMHSLNKESDQEFSKRKMLLRDQASSEKNSHVKHDDLKVTKKSVAQGVVSNCWMLLPVMLLKTI